MKNPIDLAKSSRYLLRNGEVVILNEVTGGPLAEGNKLYQSSKAGLYSSDPETGHLFTPHIIESALDIISIAPPIVN